METHDSAAQSGLVDILAHLGRSEDDEEIHHLLARKPALCTPAGLALVESMVDAAEAGAPGDWWALTRAAVLVRGAVEGTFAAALCWVRARDLLPIGPDDIAERARRWPELLSRQADEFLRRFEDNYEPGSVERHQVTIRRDLIRHLALQANAERYQAAMQAEADFEATGRLADLDRALAIRRGLLTEGAPYVGEEFRQMSRQGMSRVLRTRHRVTGAIEDLDEAIDVAAGGLDVVQEPALRGALLTELASGLNQRFRELHRREDVDRAIKAYREVGSLPLPADGDPDDAVTNDVNLSVAYLDRYHHFKNDGDLDLALRFARRAVDDTPADSRRRWLRLNNLASVLRAVGARRRSSSALAEAVDLYGRALGTPSAVDRAHFLSGMAQALEDAAEAGLAVDDAEPLFRRACQEGLEVNLNAAVWAGMSWARGAWERRDWPTAGEAYGYAALAARRLLHNQRSEASKEVRLSQFREVGSRAAYALARSGRRDEAVLAFELSRAQLLAEAMSGKGIVADRGDVAGPLPKAGDVVLTVNEIRALAAGRTVAYVVPTEVGGVALVVDVGDVAVIDLPGLTVADVERRVEQQLSGEPATGECRTWMWDTIMGPLTARVDRSVGVVLVSGGLLGLLPLHAASTPDPSSRHGERYALDELELTYAPSARALRGRRSPAPPEGTATLIVAEPQPVTGGALPMALPEAEAVRSLLPGATLLSRTRADVQAVHRALAGASTMHFACHGNADLSEPIRSGLVLAEDRVLSVGDLRAARLASGMAVLSACETGVPGAALPDEVVGLPSALLAAGVTTVIASLWAVRDASTAMLMAELYRRLVRDRAAPAAALRGAQQWLRDTSDEEKLTAFARAEWLSSVVRQWFAAALRSGQLNCEDPAVWAPFIHVGA